MRRVVFTIMLATSMAGCTSTRSPASFISCDNHPKLGLEDTIACYRQTVENQPLEYSLIADTQVTGIEQRTYRMTSQSWSPEKIIQPEEWLHDVTVYIPENALHKRALLIANNASRYSKEGTGPAGPTDFSPKALAAIAKSTGTVVVSVADVPNEYLTYTDDGKTRSEDDSVAHGWTLFMKDPAQGATMPLHVPMVAAISRAMTLAERELTSLDIHRFVVSGISKRAWASWLAVVADQRIDAVAPFVIDLLDMRETLTNMYRSYGENWPIAFYPYYVEGIDKSIDTPQFSSLMRIEDPISYLDTRYAQRLAIPKYIVNASGDDFFVPDNSRFYYDRLPGDKVMRLVPNSSHGGIRNSAADALTHFVNRIQRSVPLPEIRTALEGSGANRTISFQSSERSQKLLLWSATNLEARDFRYACGVRYTSTMVDTRTDQIPVGQPESGWSAYFVEATFSDGFVATSPAYVLGKQEYSLTAPPAHGNACRTLQGRGLYP